jgi:Tfp pilus assembly protein FimT
MVRAFSHRLAGRTRRRRGARGVSLIDALTALAVVSVAVTLASVSVAPVLHAATARSATEQLVSDLRLTRMKAIAQNTRFRVAIDDEAGTYTVEREIGIGNFATDEGPFSLPAASAFGAVEPGNPIFDARGGANAMTTITVSAPHGRTHIVTISVLGQVQAS